MKTSRMNRKPRSARATKKASAFALAGFTVLATAVSFAAFEPALPPALAQQTAGVFVPGFWDPKRRPERPESGRLTTIRFLTEEDYPPFNFRGPGGQPAGFNVDLARAICAELNLVCTIQVRRFNTLLDSLNDNRGDAAIASLAITPQNRARADFTDRYYRTPARFIARKEVLLDQITPEAIAGRRVAVVAGTAHEAYLRDFFPETVIRSYPNVETALAALKRAEAELMFGDGVALAFWLNGTGSANCCVFRGGPFTESRYFGEGVGIAVRRGNENLRRALDYALFRVWEKGTYTELYLRYFPISFY
jgi:polar amino acid transport system substrate-binding protein